MRRTCSSASFIRRIACFSILASSVRGAPCTTGNCEMHLGIFGPITSISTTFLATAVMFDLDFKKSYDANLANRFGPPIVTIPNLNPNLRIKVTIGTSNSEGHVGVGTALDFLLGRDGFTPIAGLVGGFHSSISMPVASVASYLNVPQVSWGSTNSDLSSKAQYPFFCRTIPPDSIQGAAMWQFISHFEIPSVTLVYSTEPYGEGLFQVISSLAAMANETFRVSGVAVKYMPGDYDTREAYKSVTLIKARGTKFVFLMMVADQTTPFAYVLEDLGVFSREWQLFGSESVRILVDGIYRPSIGSFPNGFIQFKPKSRGPLFSKFESMWLHMTVNDLIGPSQITTYSIDKFKVPLADGRISLPTDAMFTTLEHIDLENPFLFDAAYTFVAAFNEMVNAGIDIDDIKGQALLDAVKAANFSGVSGEVSFNDDGDRLALYVIDNVQPSVSDSGSTYKTVAIFSSASNQISPLPGQSLLWMAGVSQWKVPESLVACPPGSFHEANICVLCNSGYYQSGLGASTCIRCELGQYSDTSGASACKHCKATMTTKYLGTSSYAACGCGVNRFLFCADGNDFDLHWCSVARLRNRTSSTTVCIGCPSGFTCPGFFMSSNRTVYSWKGGDALYHAQPIVNSGYYATADAPYVAFKCKKKASCTGGTPGYTCSALREGLMCSLCEEGSYAKVDGTCSKCDAAIYIFLAVGSLVVLCILVFLYRSSLQEPHFTSPAPKDLIAFTTSQLITTCQVLYVSSAKSSDLPSPYSEVARVVSFFFDFKNAFSFECVASGLRDQMYPINLSLFFLPCILLLCSHLAYSAYYRGRYGGAWYGYAHFVNATGSWAMLCLIPLLYQLAAPFHCESHPNGQETVHSYPYVICWKSEKHKAWLIITAVSLVLILIFLAAVLMAVLRFPSCFLKARLITESPNLLQSWNELTFEHIRSSSSYELAGIHQAKQFLYATHFLFFRVRPKKHWFVVVLLGRSFAISIAPLLTNRVVELVIMLIALLTSSCLTLYHLPWPVFYSNITDVAMTMGLVFAVFTVSISMENLDLDSLGVISFWVSIFLGSVYLLTMIFGVYKVYISSKNNRRRKFRTKVRKIIEAGGAEENLRLTELKKSKRFSSTRSSTMNAIIQEEMKILSEEGGISVEYLVSGDFAELAQSKCQLKDPCFYDLKDPFWRCDDALGKFMKCPRDGLPGVALVDFLPRKHRRKCTHYLSWTWGYQVSVMINTIHRWTLKAGIEVDKAFLFCCFFCNNQFRILDDDGGHGSRNLEDIFEVRICSCSAVIALLDTWDNPRYLTRVWTIYEQYFAIQKQIPITFILPESASESLLQTLSRGDEGFQTVADSLSSIDSETAEASDERDEVKVKAVIRSVAGFTAVNRAVARSMIAWLSRVMKEHFENVLDDCIMSSLTGMRRTLDLEGSDLRENCRDSIGSSTGQLDKLTYRFSIQSVGAKTYTPLDFKRPTISFGTSASSSNSTFNRPTFASASSKKLMWI